MWSVVMLSPTLSSTCALEARPAAGPASGRGLMFGPAHDLDVAGPLGGGMIRLSSMRKSPASSIAGGVAQVARVGDPPGAGPRPRRPPGWPGRPGVVCGAAAALEVAVEGAQRDRAGRRRLAHADARPAGRFQDARARGDQVGQAPRLRAIIVEHLPRAGRDRQAHVRVHLLALAASPPPVIRSV